MNQQVFNEAKKHFELAESRNFIEKIKTLYYNYGEKNSIPEWKQVYEELLFFSAKLNSLELRNRQGVLDNDEYHKMQNKIFLGFQHIITQIDSIYERNNLKTSSEVSETAINAQKKVILSISQEPREYEDFAHLLKGLREKFGNQSVQENIHLEEVDLDKKELHILVSENDLGILEKLVSEKVINGLDLLNEKGQNGNSRLWYFKKEINLGYIISGIALFITIGTIVYQYLGTESIIVNYETSFVKTIYDPKLRHNRVYCYQQIIIENKSGESVTFLGIDDGMEETGWPYFTPFISSTDNQGMRPNRSLRISVQIYFNSEEETVPTSPQDKEFSNSYTRMTDDQLAITSVEIPANRTKFLNFYFIFDPFLYETNDPMFETIQFLGSMRFSNGKIVKIINHYSF